MSNRCICFKNTRKVIREIFTFLLLPSNEYKALRSKYTIIAKNNQILIANFNSSSEIGGKEMCHLKHLQEFEFLQLTFPQLICRLKSESLFSIILACIDETLFSKGTCLVLHRNPYLLTFNSK